MNIASKERENEIIKNGKKHPNTTRNATIYTVSTGFIHYWTAIVTTCIFSAKGRSPFEISNTNKCTFTNKWLTDANYSSWFRTFKGGKHKCIGSLCDKIIDESIFSFFKGISATGVTSKTENELTHTDLNNNGTFSIPSPPTQPYRRPWQTLDSFVLKDNV